MYTYVDIYSFVDIMLHALHVVLSSSLSVVNVVIVIVAVFIFIAIAIMYLHHVLGVTSSEWVYHANNDMHLAWWSPEMCH